MGAMKELDLALREAHLVAIPEGLARALLADLRQVETVHMRPPTPPALVDARAVTNEAGRRTLYGLWYPARGQVHNVGPFTYMVAAAAKDPNCVGVTRPTPEAPWRLPTVRHSAPNWPALRETVTALSEWFNRG